MIRNGAIPSGQSRELRIADSLCAGVLAVLALLVAYGWSATVSKSEAGLDLGEHFIPAEDLRVISHDPSIKWERQSTSKFKLGAWQGQAHMIASGGGRSGYVELGIPVPSPGVYRLTAHMTKSYDYGIVQFSINGTALGGGTDLWSDMITQSDPVVIGEMALDKGLSVLRLEVVGTHKYSKSPHYQFAVDGIRLDPIRTE